MTAEQRPDSVEGLIARLEANERTNALDVLVEVATFEPCETYSFVQPNNAGTKVIYTKRAGGFETCWARDWSLRPEDAIAILKARTAAEADSVGIAAGDEPKPLPNKAKGAGE